jgi:nucleotide-binding universal stress UspA family protein
MLPEKAILREIESADVDLIVLGVDHIRGENLSFGGIAASVLKDSKVSVVPISTGDAARKEKKLKGSL